MKTIEQLELEKQSAKVMADQFEEMFKEATKGRRTIAEQFEAAFGVTISNWQWEQVTDEKEANKSDMTK